MSLLTVEDCKLIIKKLGMRHNVHPALISSRLLSKEDKQDMLDGNLSIEALVCAVSAWIAAGKPDYAQGNTAPLDKI